MNHRAIEYNITDLLTFVSRFPTSLMELDMVVKKTQKGALYYNITLRGLEVPLQAYEAYVTRISCEENSGRCYAHSFREIKAGVARISCVGEILVYM